MGIVVLLFVAMPIVEAVYQIIQTKSIQNPYVCDAYAIIKASDKWPRRRPASPRGPETTGGEANGLEDKDTPRSRPRRGKAHDLARSRSPLPQRTHGR